ncbi:KCNH7 protein, partial [Polyodon spathula]|nr:KCNH7 protein [Polyodon spathula]
FDSAEPGMLGFKYFLDAIYILNIISRFYIGFESQGVVIMDKKQLQKRYLQGWFTVDLFAIFPFEFVILTYPEKDIWVLLSYCRLNRIVKVVRLFSFISSLTKEPELNKVHVATLNYFCIIVIFIHSAACVWYALACTPVHHYEGRHCSERTAWPFLLINIGQNITEFSVLEAYIVSLYWGGITITTVGYGDIHALTILETVYSVFIMFTALGVLVGVIMTGMSSIITNLDARRGRFYHRLYSIKLNMVGYIDLPPEVQTWVEKYYVYLWKHRKGTIIAGLLDDLPFSIHSEISLACNQMLLKKSTLFRGTDEGFKRALSVSINPYTYSAGQILAKRGESNQSMYYLEHGLVQAIEDNAEKIATVLPGSLIGEIYLMYKIPRNVTICAATLCEIYVLHQKDLLNLFADFPDAGVKIAQTARNRLQNIAIPIKDAFDVGAASNPQNVVFHKDLGTNLLPKDQKIFKHFMDYVIRHSDRVPASVKTSLEGTVKQPFWMKTLRPDSKYIQFWEVFLLCSLTVAVFLEVWVVLFTFNEDSLGFNNSGFGASLHAVAYIIDLVAVVDIVINLRTQVVSKNGNQSDFKSIYKNYQRTWNLYYDVAAVLPTDMFTYAEEEHLRWSYLGLFRINRLVWLRKVYLFYVKRENDLEKNLLRYRALKCVFMLTFSIHTCAGLFYLAGCFKHKCDPGSWAEKLGFTKYDPDIIHYIAGIYWAGTTMTTTGFGDISGSTAVERIICIFVSVIGAFIFNYIVSQIGATLASTNAARVGFQNRLVAMTYFMESHDLSQSLQQRVIQYMSLLWEKYHGQAYPGGPFLMYDLPTELQQIVLLKERGKLLSKLPFFYNTGSLFIRELATTSIMYFYPKGEIIQYSETISQELFCIRRGCCQILSDDLNYVYGVYTEGMYFGEAGFLFGKPATMTLRAKTYCEVLVINFDRSHKVFDKYPAIRSQLESLKEKKKYHSTLVRYIDMMVKQRLKKIGLEEKTSKKKRTLLTYQGRRFSKKSKCYVEDFGNFPIYAGAEEESVKEKLEKLSKTRLVPHKPKTLRGKLSLFFFMTLPEVFLMTSAILPSNRLYIRWEIFRIFLALTVSIFTSTLISFLHFKRELWFTCYILGGFCWLDMYVRLHVAFYKDNKLKVDTLETARHYVRTSFLLDLVSCFPFEVFAWTVVSPFDESGNFYTNYKAMHLYAYLRVPHILQLYRIPLAYNYWQMAIATEKLVVTFLQFFLYMILFIHFSTCLIYAVPCGPVLNINIIENDTNNIFKHLCDNKSWVMQLRETFGTDHSKLSFKEIYTISMYFSTTTIFNVGYGDLCSHTFKMDIALFTLMVLGSLYFGWMVGTVTSILANADAARAVYTEKLDSIKHFLKSQKITGTIADSVQKFYSFKWIKTKGVDPETLFEYLPSSLLGDISTIIYSDVIAKAFGLNIKTKKTKECSSHVLTPLERRLSGKLDGPIFEKTLSKESLEKLETDGGFIRMLATKIRPCVFRANDIICKRNDYGSEMFFIEKGEVDVLSQDERSVMVTLKAGQYFGEGSLLFSEPRSTSIRASTNCDMYVLDKKDLDSTVKYYPDICQEIRDSAIAKREHLLKLKAHQLQISKMETVKNGDKFDAGFNQMYLKYMAEQELKSKYVALPLIVRMRTAFCKFYNDSLKKIIQLHNMTIDPEKTLRIILQYTSCLFVIISFWTITYMLFLFQIFLKFHICYCDANGTYICDYQSVSKYYLKRKAGFVFDMFCSFPFALIVLLQNDSSVNLFDYHMSHIRLFHCLRLFNVFFFIREEEERITTNLMLIRVFKFIVLMSLFVHISAVFFLIMACPQTCHNGWPQLTGHTDELASVYIYAIYWATATFTTTGYGDIRAVTYPEIWFCILVMLLSKTLVGYNIGIISSTQTNKNSLQVSYEEKLQTIKNYMEEENIPPSLQQRVMQFYNYRWARTRGVDFDLLFSDTPSCMKTELFARIAVNLMKKQRMFTHLSDTFLRHMSTKMKLKSYTPGEYLAMKGDIGTEMFLILHGKVSVKKFGADHKEVVEHLVYGNSYGTVFLIKRMSFPESVVAENYVDILTLSKDDFEEIGSFYPEVMSKL